MRPVSFSVCYGVILPDKYDDMEERDVMKDIQENWFQMLADDNEYDCMFGDILEIGDTL